MGSSETPSKRIFDFKGLSVRPSHRYPSDIPLTQGYLMGVGSSVIPRLKPHPIMVEVECPSCTKTVDLGSDSTGTYECPYCSEDFQYEVDKSTRDARLIDEIEYGGLKPDYVFKEIRYLDSMASKIIPTMVAICFIPLLGAGLVIMIT
jgi:hypothetical protein